MSESEIKQILVAIAKLETKFDNFEGRLSDGVVRFNAIEKTQKDAEKEATGATLKAMMRTTELEDDLRAHIEAGVLMNAQRSELLKEIQEDVKRLAPMHWAYSILKVAIFLGCGAFAASYFKIPIK